MNTRIVYILCLLCAVVLLATSCATHTPSGQPEGTSGDVGSETGADVTDSDETRIDVIVDYDTEIPTMNTYKEYVEYIAKIKLPDNFVPYEAFSDFGSFDCFVFHGREYEYIYSIRDASLNRDLSITVYLYPMEEKFAVSSSEQEDMLRFECKGWGYLQVENIYYRYYDGTLRWLYVDMGDYYYTIGSGGELYTLQSSEDAFVSRLLTRSTAKETANELIESIKAARKELKLD